MDRKKGTHGITSKNIFPAICFLERIQEERVTDPDQTLRPIAAVCGSGLLEWLLQGMVQASWVVESFLF